MVANNIKNLHNNLLKNVVIMRYVNKSGETHYGAFTLNIQSLKNCTGIIYNESDLIKSNSDYLKLYDLSIYSWKTIDIKNIDFNSIITKKFSDDYLSWVDRGKSKFYSNRKKLLELLNNNKLDIVFIKKDGSLREMTCSRISGLSEKIDKINNSNEMNKLCYSNKKPVTVYEYAIEDERNFVFSRLLKYRKHGNKRFIPFADSEENIELELKELINKEYVKDRFSKYVNENKDKVNVFKTFDLNYIKTTLNNNIVRMTFENKDKSTYSLFVTRNIDIISKYSVKAFKGNFSDSETCLTVFNLESNSFINLDLTKVSEYDKSNNVSNWIEFDINNDAWFKVIYEGASIINYYEVGKIKALPSSRSEYRINFEKSVLIDVEVVKSLEKFNSDNNKSKSNEINKEYQTRCMDFISFATSLLSFNIQDKSNGKILIKYYTLNSDFANKAKVILRPGMSNKEFFNRLNDKSLFIDNFIEGYLDLLNVETLKMERIYFDDVIRYSAKSSYLDFDKYLNNNNNNNNNNSNNNNNNNISYKYDDSDEYDSNDSDYDYDEYDDNNIDLIYSVEQELYFNLKDSFIKLKYVNNKKEIKETICTLNNDIIKYHTNKEYDISLDEFTSKYNNKHIFSVFDINFLQWRTIGSNNYFDYSEEDKLEISSDGISYVGYNKSADYKKRKKVLDLLDKHVVELVFTKADGSLRRMFASRKSGLNAEVDKTLTDSFNYVYKTNGKISVSVFDLQKKEERRFVFERLLRFRVKGSKNYIDYKTWKEVDSKRGRRKIEILDKEQTEADFKRMSKLNNILNNKAEDVNKLGLSYKFTKDKLNNVVMHLSSINKNLIISPGYIVEVNKDNKLKVIYERTQWYRTLKDFIELVYNNPKILGLNKNQSIFLSKVLAYSWDLRKK